MQKNFLSTSRLLNSGIAKSVTRWYVKLRHGGHLP